VRNRRENKLGYGGGDASKCCRADEPWTMLNGTRRFDAIPGVAAILALTSFIARVEAETPQKSRGKEGGTWAEGTGALDEGNR
jgi:hypothetical protein